jgi:3-deoxy-manno-octulosonate cytidylyltransferase (CMP-KDO synthetase)
LTFHVVIPARYAASRLPGKPLALIDGQPLIQRVWSRAMASGAASVVIATDDARILQVARDFGADGVMTQASHQSGTDRIAEVVRARGWADAEIVINVQGDEPTIDPALIADLAGALRAQSGVDIATAVAPVVSLSEFLDPNCVKAVRAADGRALYFSRAPVPWPREAVVDGQPTRYEGAWRHIGIYGYRVRSLLQFSAWEPSQLELQEKLEQLRALEHGMRIHLVALAVSPPAGVDTPADLERVRALFERGQR